MKRLKIAFGLAVMAGLMALIVSPALAATPSWVQCREKAGGGQWENNSCTKAKANGGWETKAVTETLEATASGELELEDKKAGSAVKCSSEGTGTVGANGTASAKTVTNIKCKFIKAGSCEESKGITGKPLNLPWAARLEERTGGEIRAVFTSLVAGKAPGFVTECTVGGVFKVSDECTGIISTGIKGNRATKAIEATLDKTSEEEPSNCSVGGEKQGFVRGTIFLSVLILFILIAVWILIN